MSKNTDETLEEILDSNTSLFKLGNSNLNEPEICIIEPFYGGSHKQLIDLIKSELDLLNLKYDLYTMSAKKWHWRARCSSLYFSQIIKKSPYHKYKYKYLKLRFLYFSFINKKKFSTLLFRVLFASSVLNLAELVALRPDLASTNKIIYYHENQLVYPIRKQSTRNKTPIEFKEQRDFQYGYNQILTRSLFLLHFYSNNKQING